MTGTSFGRDRRWKEKVFFIEDRLLQNEKNQRIRVSDVITADDIRSWTPEVPVIILSGTGTGKSHFVKNSMYDVAKEDNERILMLIHRINCVRQFRMEIKEQNKQEVIDVDTYQKVQSDELNNKDYEFGFFRYLVNDEFHYFLGDANFNNATDVSFEKIMALTNTIKVFMSATGEDVAAYIRNYAHVEPLIYKLNLPKPPIGHLSFFLSDETIRKLAKAIIEKGEKGIFFINSARKAYQLYDEFSSDAIFNCGKQHELHDKVNDDVIEEMLKNERFEKPLLFTTACMDAGVNLIDPALKYVVVDNPDVWSLIQCIGRKRSQSDDDLIDVYIKTEDNASLGRRKGRIRQSLRMADFLRTHNTDEFLLQFPRQFDPTGIVYDARVPGSKEYSTKRINELMYQKRMNDIAVIDEMLSYGEYGYCKYMARLLGKYDPIAEYYDYTAIKGDGSLEDYLDAHVGQIMLQRKDRKELIRKMDVKRNRKVKSSREILNAALMEDNLPYRIEEFETSRIVEINGKKEKKKYKNAWRIVRHDWSVR